MSTPPHILVVDDNQAAADSLVRLLKALGKDAKAVYGPHEALEHIKDASVALAFIDIGMPDMDGYELIHTLRDTGFSAPAFALSGYGRDDDREQARDAGFTGHLTKPTGAKDIQEVLLAHGDAHSA